MPRDSDIQNIFEIADDSLQGILGYYLYILAMQKSSNSRLIMNNLPDSVDESKEPAIPLTFSWIRFYKKEDLVNALKEPVFECFQSRITLLVMVSIFEVALGNFIKILNEKGHTQSLTIRASAKSRLKWAHTSSIKCDVGDKKAIERLSSTFSIIDNARRLRNLIIHNQGIFEERYRTDGIVFEKSKMEFHRGYELYEKNLELKFPILLDSKDVFRFSQAHIEVLHILHNYLQKRYFGFPRAYSYVRENKPIEWEKALWGEAKVLTSTAKLQYIKK